jgi:predicted TPR repeat methyltransferase
MLIVYGDILEKSGKKKQAIAQYKQALRFLPNDPKAAAALKRLGAKVPSSTTEAPNGPGGTGMPPIPVPTPSGN